MLCQCALFRPSLVPIEHFIITDNGLIVINNYFEWVFFILNGRLLSKLSQVMAVAFEAKEIS